MFDNRFSVAPFDDSVTSVVGVENRPKSSGHAALTRKIDGRVSSIASLCG